jgi:hypothetical protein
MKMKNNHIILTLFFIVNCIFIVQTGWAQNDSSFKFIKKIKGNYSSFAVDNLDNIYLITGKNQLKKINSNGDSSGVYNDVKKYGTLSYLDVKNPLKIILYYQNYGTVVVLDRFLNFRNTINLRKQNIFSVQTITASYDNAIWLFDEQEYKLEKMNESGKKLLETVDCRILLNEAISPQKIIDYQNFVYLYDAENGFYIFDYYGTYKNKLSFTGWRDVEIANNTIYGFKENRLLTYTLNSPGIKEYSLPAFFGNYTSVKTMNGKLYMLNKEGISVYQAW